MINVSLDETSDFAYNGTRKFVSNVHSRQHMRLINVDPRELQPNPWNTNHVSHENDIKLRASLRKHGMFKPLVVRELEDGTLQLLGGAHRAGAAIDEGITPVPAFNLGRVDDARAKEIGLIDNARYGSDDTLKLAELLEELGLQNVEPVMPWSAAEVDMLSASIAVDVDQLDLDEDEQSEPEDRDQGDAPKVSKTHEIMRFKVGLGDAERLRRLIRTVIKDQGFTGADDLTNAGDALAHILLTETIDAA